MNEKGCCYALGGLSAVVRTAVSPQAENFTSASTRIARMRAHARSSARPFPRFIFHLLALARISGGAVSKLFLCLAVKGRAPCWRDVYVPVC